MFFEVRSCVGGGFEDIRDGGAGVAGQQVHARFQAALENQLVTGIGFNALFFDESRVHVVNTLTCRGNKLKLAIRINLEQGLPCAQIC